VRGCGRAAMTRRPLDMSRPPPKGTAVIVDLRIYTCRPNHLDAFVALYREHAWPLQQKYLGRCVGWYVTVEGQLNQVVHMWAYDSQADREQRRSAMAADPAWQAYLKKAAEAGYLVHMENRIIKPAAHWTPLPGM
jgi:hypothetical protein